MNLLINKYIFELYLRLSYILLSFIFSFIISYISFEEIFYLIANPLISIRGSSKFIYTDLNELFFSSVMISIFFSLILLIPIFVGHIWFFFIPLISNYWRHIFNKYIFGIIVMIILGLLFAYYIIIPLTWHFFFTFEFNSNLLSIRLEAKINQYLYNIVFYIYIFIILFQLIYLIFIFLYLNIIQLNTIINNRFFIFLINVSITSLITPPDLKLILFIIMLLFTLNEILIIYLTLCKIIPFMKNKRNKLNNKIKLLLMN